MQKDSGMKERYGTKNIKINPKENPQSCLNNNINSNTNNGNFKESIKQGFILSNKLKHLFKVK